MQPDEVPDTAAPPSLPADTPPAVAAPQPTTPRVTLRRYVGKDGVKLAQDEIYLDVRGTATRYGYVAHPPHVGIAFIRSVTAAELAAIQQAVGERFGQPAEKVVHAPGVGDLSSEVFQDILEDEFTYGGET